MAIDVIGTGLSGLIGSKLVSGYSEEYNFENLDLSQPTHPVDITNVDQVQSALERSPAEFVVHMAAFTDVTAAFAQQGDTNGPAYKVNVVGTENLVSACEAFNKHLIHVSTAFVFDGEKETPYTEEDQPHPIEWYGQTKADAEQAVMNSGANWTILRIDFPFRSDPFPKPDIVRKTIANMHRGLPLFKNHYFGPTFIDDFVKVIDWVLRTGTTGLFHASSGESWNDYQFGMALNQALNLGLEVQSGDLNEYLKTTQRPYQRNTALDCAKLKNAIDFELQPIREALTKIQL